jgi:hypothetical protein
MKKVIFLFLVLALTLSFTSTSHAWVYTGYPYNGDDMVTYDRSSYNGWDHAFVYFKNCDDTAVQVVINPDGTPVIYYYGEFNYYYYTLDIYYSYDGWNWYYSGWVYI